MKRVNRLICIFIILFSLDLYVMKSKLRTKNNFSQTCSNISYSANTATLNANCLNFNQVSLQTSIPLNNCVDYKNGVLQFLANWQYSSTCNSCTVSSTFILNCQCPTTYGSFTTSAIDLNLGINNTNGVLECGPNPPPLHTRPCTHHEC